MGVYTPSGNTGTFTYTNLTIPRGETGPVINPPASAHLSITYGLSADVPIAADYDGDGIDDLAFWGYDPTQHLYRYAVITSSTGFNTADVVYKSNAPYGFGYSADIPLMGDFQGIGKADLGVYQPIDVTNDGNNDNTNAYFYDVWGTGQIIDYYFITTSSSDLPADAPPWMLAKKVTTGSI